MKRGIFVVAAGIVSLSICAPILARGLSAQEPDFFPNTATTDTNDTSAPNVPYLYTDFASLTIAEPDASFVYQLSFAPGTRPIASAAGTNNPSDVWQTPSSSAPSYCNGTYISDGLYSTAPLCTAYMLNWGSAPTYQFLSSKAPPVSSQVMVYQFDSASAIAQINCSNDPDGDCAAPSVADSALTLSASDGSSVVIAKPVDVIEVDFNYSATTCKGRRPLLTVNDVTYVYTGKDVCAERNAFFFYVTTEKSGARVAKLAAPKPAHWSIG